MPKDLFSSQSAAYARFRPGYPPELIHYLLQFVEERTRAWDCATGNGQAAVMLSEYFSRVDATDISEAQLGNAFRKENIYYQKAPAEQTPFPASCFDLITIATAYHWLNWNSFHKEATRVGRPGAVVAAWCYYTCRTTDEKLNALYEEFYHNITGDYWDVERKFVDDRYQSVAFDFDPLPEKEFRTELQWNRQQFEGYLGSWSAVQHYTRENGRSPLELIQKELETLWPGQSLKTVVFPLCLRLGRIVK